MTNLYTNNEKQIAVTAQTDTGAWYQAVRNGKGYGRQFFMKNDRFLTEFVPVIDWEPCEERDLRKGA
jgi:hypothetical protein